MVGGVHTPPVHLHERAVFQINFIVVQFSTLFYCPKKAEYLFDNPLSSFLFSVALTLSDTLRM